MVDLTHHILVEFSDVIVKSALIYSADLLEEATDPLTSPSTLTLT